ncbi:MAG TPA: coenzyme F420-0:L-glutamate ligase, partial [Thermofilum sp.]|nr:coenzyme F420-0:L-glutamate ligase [Thermofilum sp.]
MPRIEIIGLKGVPEIKPGDDLARIIVETAEQNNVKIEDGDVIVVKSKIISKAEGRIVELEKVEQSEKAR